MICARNLRSSISEAVRKIDLKNRRRLVRALEICLVTGKSASAQRQQWTGDVGNARSGGLQSAAEGSGIALLGQCRQDCLRHRLQASSSSATGKSFTNESINEWK